MQAGLDVSGVSLLLGIRGSPGLSTGHCSSFLWGLVKGICIGYFGGFQDGEDLKDLDLSVLLTPLISSSL